MVFLNTPKPKKTDSEKKNQFHEIKIKIKFEISMFNMLLENLIDATVKTKHSKMTQDIAECISLKFRRSYHFNFLLNKCHCFEIFQDEFAHLFEVNSPNFVKCITSLPEKEKQKDLICLFFKLFISFLLGKILIQSYNIKN